MSPIWSQELFQKIAFMIFTFLFGLGVISFLLRKYTPRALITWVSIKSWFILTPILLFVLALPEPYPTGIFALTAIYCVKTFFRMCGIYHRSYFLIICYIFVGIMAYCIQHQMYQTISLLPMIFLSAVALVPLLRNSFSHMVQYMSLTLMAFMFFGWALMHFALILQMKGGVYLVIYIYFLAELNDTVYRVMNQSLGRLKLFSRIAPRFTLEGFLIALLSTLALAWFLRPLLPLDSSLHWSAIAIIVCLFARLGTLTVSVIRRDLGIHDNDSPFVIGRHDLLARVDKLIFVAPVFYYVFLMLHEMP